MVCGRDVGQRAAALLIQDPFTGPPIQELHGAGDYSMTEVVKILGQAIGRDDVHYLQVSIEDARSGMLASGASPSFIDAIMDTARSYNEGEECERRTCSPQEIPPQRHCISSHLTFLYRRLPPHMFEIQVVGRVDEYANFAIEENPMIDGG